MASLGFFRASRMALPRVRSTAVKSMMNAPQSHFRNVHTSFAKAQKHSFALPVTNLSFQRNLGKLSNARKDTNEGMAAIQNSPHRGELNTAEMRKIIADYYETGHAPLTQRDRVYGPPHLNVKELEALPAAVYDFHHEAKTLTDKFAFGLVKFFQIWTRLIFRDKYAHHAVVLETVAAVPGMIAGMLRHMRSLRRMERDFGWINKLLEEAENERMHLLIWMQVTRPTLFERLVVLAAQAFYTPLYGFLYVLSPTLSHRFVGYLEEVACHEYTQFLKAIDDGVIPNGPAPDIAKFYYNLAPDSTLRDVVLAVRADEAMHRDVNHDLSGRCRQGVH